VGAFDTIGIAGTGLFANRKWMDAVSDNVANMNNASSTDQPAFQERMITAQAVDYGSGVGGVQVTGEKLGSADGVRTYEPDNPLADSDGYVKYPDIDLGDQMTQLIQAQRSYQANLQTMKSATEAYQSALQLGKG
jgi:flagellar basal-body rod protein FlgC